MEKDLQKLTSYKENKFLLNLDTENLFKVQMDAGLWILNMAGEGRTIEQGGVAIEIPAKSIVRR